MLAHCGDSTDLDYLEKLAASGALLGMDRFGLDVLLPFEERVGTVVAMCERGHADKMILSQDANCFSDWFPPGLHEQVTPKWHFLHVLQDVVPALLERGVAQEDVDKMLRENPRRFFDGRLERQQDDAEGRRGDAGALHRVEALAEEEVGERDRHDRGQRGEDGHDAEQPALGRLGVHERPGEQQQAGQRELRQRPRRAAHRARRSSAPLTSSTTTATRASSSAHAVPPSSTASGRAMRKEPKPKAERTAHARRPSG